MLKSPIHQIYALSPLCRPGPGGDELPGHAGFRSNGIKCPRPGAVFPEQPRRFPRAYGQVREWGGRFIALLLYCYYVVALELLRIAKR